MGLAREVVELIQQNHVARNPLIDEPDLKQFQNNFGTLIRRLAEMQRRAERETSQERISRKIDRIIKSFGNDHPTSAKREEAILLLEDIDSALDDSNEADHVRGALQQLKRNFDLNEPKPGYVESFARFSQELGRVRYSALNAVQQETVDLSQQQSDTPATETVSNPKAADQVNGQPSLNEGIPAE